MLSRIREQLPECSLVVLDRLELNSGILRLLLIDEVFLKNPLLQICGFGNDHALINQVIHGEKQKRYRGQTLLAVNDKELLIMAIRIVNKAERVNSKS